MHEYDSQFLDRVLGFCRDNPFPQNPEDREEAEQEYWRRLSSHFEGKYDGDFLEFCDEHMGSILEALNDDRAS